MAVIDKRGSIENSGGKPPLSPLTPTLNHHIIDNFENVKNLLRVIHMECSETNIVLSTWLMFFSLSKIHGTIFAH